MKKIALIISTLQNGGAERVVSNLSLLLQKYYKVTIILFDARSIDYPYSGEIIDIEVSAAGTLMGKAINLFRRIASLKTIKKQYDFEVCISFMEGANLVNILSKRNEKTVISVREYLSKKHQNKYTIIQKWLIKMLYNKSDKVITVSELLKGSLHNEYDVDFRRIVTIYNPYDICKIQELCAEESSFDERVILEPTFISVGRLDEPKGHWHLIRAFYQLRQKITNAQLILLGEGPLEDYLKKLVDDLHLGDCVAFIGFQKNPFKFIRRASVFVSSSLWEGFPNVICEAMACGAPVISTDCRSGPREILAPETDCHFETEDIEFAEYGILVPVSDGTMYDANALITKEEELLAKAMCELIENQPLMKEYQVKSLERVKVFSKDKIMKEWIKVIEE